MRPLLILILFLSARLVFADEASLRRLQIFDGQARGEAELLSLRHQRDLLQALASPKRATKIREIGLDPGALEDGVVDSDLGKLLSQWEFTIFRETPVNEEFLNFLRGTSRSPAGEALSSLLEASGYKTASLLGPELTNAEVREVFRASPELRSYLHELPGLYFAMEELNARRTSVTRFQHRVAANLFHNDGATKDSGAGFFRAKLEAKIVAKGMAKLRPELATKLFKNTVFARADSPLPIYGQPLSAGGVLHAILDRLSQGTRGGILKILAEMPDKGLAEVRMLLESHIEDTIAQLQGLRVGIQILPRLTSEQKTFLDEEAEAAIHRLQSERDFFTLNTDIEVARETLASIRFRETERAIRLNASADPHSCAWFLSHVTAREEEYNFNPMR